MNIEERESWMLLIIHYLKWGKVLNNEKETEKVKRQLTYFVIENNQLYKKRFTLLLLRCLHPEEANYVLREIHKGIYGSHLARTTITLKAIQSG